jgi:methyl-accepting chemotaxis protein
LCLLTLQISGVVVRVASDIDSITRTTNQTLVSAQKTTEASTGLVQAATKTVNGLGETQARLGTGIELLTHRLTDLCVTDGSHPCGVLADVEKTLNTARGTMGQVEVAAHSFDQHQTVFYQQESSLAAKTESTVSDMDRFISSPDLTATLKNLNDTSAALASTTQHADRVAGDIQFEADKIAHPPKKKIGFWATVWAGAQVVHKVSPPLF